jgi:hypothetical protein
MGLTGIEYEVSLLGADAWESARTTRAVHFMDFGEVRTISKVYRIQELFLQRQALVVDAIAAIDGGGGASLDQMIRPVARSLEVALGIECELMGEYRLVLGSLAGEAAAGGGRDAPLPEGC